jgi:hypothetical protein
MKSAKGNVFYLDEWMVDIFVKEARYLLEFAKSSLPRIA